MFHRDVALEALGTVLNAKVTSVQKQRSQVEVDGVRGDVSGGAAARQQLSITQFIPSVLEADDTSQVSRSNFLHIKSVLLGNDVESDLPRVGKEDVVSGKHHIIDEDEFFDPRYDYDFTKLRDTKTYRRGGEVYERPCGWYRFALKVLNKYSDGNAWLGTTYRSTQSMPGEWPVSYHGTSKQGAEGIIGGHYQPGSGQVYGRGVYSTPHMADASHYAKTFTSRTTGKKYKVILQNRINPRHRQKFNHGKYWLVPIKAGTPGTKEQKMVEEAIRPYGLLVKVVK